MLFTQSVFALAALTSTAFAQISGFDAITNPSAADQQLTPGSSFEITWQANTFTADTDTVSIILMAGETPNTLQPGTTPIASSIKNSVGKYTWTVPSSTATTYGFKIVLDASPATFQYSFPFHITGGSSSSASGSSSASVTASSTNTTTAVSSSITAPSGNTTSVKTDVLTSTVCTVCLGSNATASASTLAPVVTPSSNVTLATTIGATKTSAAGGASTAAASSTSTAKPSGNAAVSNAAQGGLALIGGLVLAFAL